MLGPFAATMIHMFSMSAFLLFLNPERERRSVPEIGLCLNYESFHMCREQSRRTQPERPRDIQQRGGEVSRHTQEFFDSPHRKLPL